MTGFYMKCNVRLKWVKKFAVLKLCEKSYLPNSRIKTYEINNT